MKKIIILLFTWTCFASAQSNPPLQTYVNAIELAKVIQIIRNEAITKVLSCPLKDDQIDLVTAAAVGFVIDKVEIFRGRTLDQQQVHISYRPEGLQGFACLINNKSKLYVTASKRL